MDRGGGHSLDAGNWPQAENFATVHLSLRDKTGGGRHVKFYPYEKGGGGLKKF